MRPARHTPGRMCDECEGFCLVSASDASAQQDADRYRWLRAHWLHVNVVADRADNGFEMTADDEACVGDEGDAVRLDRAIDAAIAKAGSAA